MILKTIYIQGFKSFLNKTKIDFNNSITGIVGPNGSGKSNITDAITWVLGETSIKNLRGSKMEDVIFSGTDKRHPTGFAEVSIVFDNSDGSIPLEFKEVQITRRMYRSLESEFLINGTKCRLKDIRELFLDTGIGKDGYSLIGQGQIDSILSNKPDERRQIFEEAAGVSKYKLRKHESELKLKRTNDNIIRLNDIVSELENREEDLKIASKNAKIYMEKSSELERLEIESASYELSNLSIKIKETQIDLEKVENNLKEVLDNVELEKNSIEILYKENESIEERIDILKKDVQTVEFNIQKDESEKNILSLKIENNINNLAYDEKTINDITENSKKSKLRLADLEEQKVVNNLEYEKLSLDIQNLSEKINSIDKEVVQKEEIINLNNLGIKNDENELAGINSKLSIFKVMSSEKENRLSNIQGSLKTLELNNLEIEKLRDSAEKSFIHNKESIKSLKNDLENLNDEKENKEILLKNLHGELELVKKNLTTKDAQLTALQNLNDSFEGYNKSIKSLMNVTKRGEFKEEIIGPVAENFKVKPEYETAISVALGASLQNVIVDKLNSAKAIIDYLNKQKMGRVTFLPMDTISYKTPDLKINSQKDALGFANELIEYDSKFDNIFKNLLGRIIVTKDFNSGNKLSSQLSNRYRVVTLRGDSFNIGGSVTGGSLNKFTSDILSRRNEINTLKNSISLLRQEYANKESILEELNAQINEIINKISTLNLDMADLNSEFLKIENNLASLKSSFESNQNYILKYQQEENELKKQILDDKKNYDLLANRKEILENQIENNSFIAEDESFLLLKEELEQIKEEKFNSSVKANELKSKENSISREIELLKENEDSSLRKKESLEKNISLINEEIGSLKEKLSFIDLNINDKIKIKDEKLVILSDFEQDRKQLNLDIKAKRQLLDDLQERRITLETDLSKNQSKIERLEDKIQLVKENILENYGIVEFPDNINETEIKNSRSVILKLKKDIESLGQVNLAAIQEYEILMERLTFTRTQIEDMLESQKEIEEIISKLDSEMKILFSNTFNKVSKYFEDIFKILFNGGRAKIELEGNVLDGGIDIKAEPPGKKLQSLSLLSGGERALTAVALLFALLKVRPAPFCILDEIDAALDDANIKKYADYLMTLEDIQFIIITHRKITMEIANVLYGVTMEEEGISKIISVKLD